MEEFTHPGVVAAASSASRVSGSSRTAVGDGSPTEPRGSALGNSALPPRTPKSVTARRSGTDRDPQ